MAHAVEALYAPDGNPATASLAERGITALAQALPRIVAQPGDPAFRSDALLGGWACGTCLGTAGMGLHPRLCHVLGGSFGLPHAATHAVVLPHVAAFNAPAAAEAMAIVARALGNADAPCGLFDLAPRLGVPRSLREIGMLAHRSSSRTGAARAARSEPLQLPARHRTDRPFSSSSTAMSSIPR